MTPEEAINAATVNGAYAMGFSNMYGSITRGKKANIIIVLPRMVAFNEIFLMPFSIMMIFTG